MLSRLVAPPWLQDLGPESKGRWGRGEGSALVTDPRDLMRNITQVIKELRNPSHLPRAAPLGHRGWARQTDVSGAAGFSERPDGAVQTPQG